MFRLRQRFPIRPALDLESEVRSRFGELREGIRPGMRVAVGVGSRGLANLSVLVRSVVLMLKEFGAVPFIVPAMGSHGGATAEGQTQLLADYGVTEEQVQAPVRAATEAERIGETEEGTAVFVAREALDADAVLLLNRIKPHTDFGGDLGSGLLKMAVVGLGKQAGASAFHAAASRIGHARVLRSAARIVLGRLPLVGGLAVLEDERHQTARIAALTAAGMEAGEGELLAEARGMMPRLPFQEIDLLIVDALGKNISGTGMDTNIIGRTVHGYSSALSGSGGSLVVRRLFVRELTAQTHGNAIGIGLADFTTSRLVRSIEPRVTAINALTALTVQLAKVPIHFETDREVIERALGTLALGEDWAKARIVRIADTLSLEHVEASEAYWEEAHRRVDLECLDEPRGMAFDEAGNLG